MPCMRKMPKVPKPNPYKGGRLGKGWHEDYIIENEPKKVEKHARRTKPKQSAGPR
jgi:hypothetical protein